MEPLLQTGGYVWGVPSRGSLVLWEPHPVEDVHAQVLSSKYRGLSTTPETGVPHVGIFQENDTFSEGFYLNHCSGAFPRLFYLSFPLQRPLHLVYPSLPSYL